MQQLRKRGRTRSSYEIWIDIDNLSSLFLFWSLKAGNRKLTTERLKKINGYY
jgi:hypothetical protein